MGSGYYPLSRTDKFGGEQLAKIADDLRELLNNRGENGGGPLPGAWDNDQTDNAASDGGYETYLYIALEFIERCLEKRP